MSTPNTLRRLVGALTLLAATHVGQAQNTDIAARTATFSTARATAISGKLRTPAGPLAGASIRLNSSGLVCVTNGDGDFFFPMPAGTGPQAALISYSGGADVTVTLAPGIQPAPIEVPAVQLDRKQQRALKKAMKYGRRQGKKDSRRLR